MKYLILLLGLTIVVSLKLELLEVFHQSLDWQSNYQPTYEKQIKKLETQITLMKQQKNTKQMQCDRINKGLDQIVSEKEKNEKFTNWLTSRIEQNNNRVNNLQNLRCSSGSLFYQSASDNQQLQNLNTFFISWISRDQKLLQLQDTQSFIQQIQDDDNQYQDELTVLQQQIRECKLSPFRSKTIDRSETYRRDFEQNVFDFQKMIKSNNEQYQLDQITVQDKMNKFIQQLNRETEQLQIHLDSILKLINKNPVEDTQKQSLDQCQKDIISIQKLIEATEEALNRIQMCSPNSALNIKQKRVLSEIAKVYSIGVNKILDNE